ncbi:BnaA02g22100D [Brassica napus]|uniref:BnaA02g22100D protein n=2 Tax=Brassica TaxID=3705 RepID=A0A078GIN2_BRANA|nr:BnaA02g22100D [Brassica napus]VDC90130.1 unnamed protein product [Brassica rapa]
MSRPPSAVDPSSGKLEVTPGTAFDRLVLTSGSATPLSAKDGSHRWKNYLSWKIPGSPGHP